MIDAKENDFDSKEEEECKDIIKVPIQLDKDNYLLKIFPSKDNISLIFKLEKEKVQTYYYYAKFDIKDFKNINKKFNSDNKIINVFLHLKDITNNYGCSLEKNLMKMNISFTKKNNESFGIFTVRKKIVAQNRLNLKLVEQIQENKAKLKIIKRQLAKLEKNIQNKNELIDNINININKMTNVVNNINMNENKIENSMLEKKSNNNNSSNNINNSNNKNSVKDSPLKESENEDDIKKIFNVNEKENLLLKQNLSSIKDYQQQSEKEQEGKRYISNNRKKKNKDKLKKIKSMFKEEEASKCDPPEDDTLFCFENTDVYKNKKIYETLILFNVITVLIIMYLLCSFFTLKSNLTMEKMRDQELMKKLAFLSLFDNYNDGEMGGIQDNIVDFQLKNHNDDTADAGQKAKYSISQKKNKEKRELSLLKEEREKKYYKKHIRKKFHFRVRDISFDLKYNSKETFKFKSLFNSYQNINEVLLIFKTKDKRKLSLFSNNIFLYTQDITSNNIDYVGFVYNNDQINEVELSVFYEKYGNYLHKIYEFLRSEYLRVKNRYNNTSYELLEDIELFEIYQVKYTR